MLDVDFELRMLLLRVLPELGLSRANALIHGVASDCLAIREDDAAHNTSEDFFTFSHITGVALIAVCQQSETVFYALAADESLIRGGEHFAMTDIEPFMQFVRSGFGVPDIRLAFANSDALAWMESHRESDPVA